MNIEIVGLFLLIVSIIFLLRWYLLQPKKFKNQSQEKINRFLNVLLKRGYNGGVLIIKVPHTELFLQFKKYIENDKVGVSLDFPKASWSSNYYFQVKELINDKQISFEIIGPLNNDRRKSVTEFMIVDFERNVLLAFETAKEILNNIFAYDSSKLITMYFIRLNPLDEWTK